MFGRNSESESAHSSTFGASSSIENGRHGSRQNLPEGSQEVSAFVGEGVEFKGIISYQGTVRIDGLLEGEIHTDGILIVGKGAVIAAKIEAGTIVCQGRIVGDIVTTDKIQLLAPAVLDGSVRTPSLSMEEGVLFNGKCQMGSTRSSSEGQFDEARVGAVESYDDSLKAV